jgi:hypothetical protein
LLAELISSCGKSILDGIVLDETLIGLASLEDEDLLDVAIFGENGMEVIVG